MDVNLNILSPTLNAGFPEVFGSGILNTPAPFPVAPVISGSPASAPLYTNVLELWAAAVVLLVALVTPVKVVEVLFVYVNFSSFIWKVIVPEELKSAVDETVTTPDPVIVSLCAIAFVKDVYLLM